jgi:hypothetical protein
MGDSKSSLKSPKDYYKFSAERKYLILTLFVLVLLFLFSGGFGLVKLVDNKLNPQKENSCGDGTLYNSCSITKPYFCLNGKLIDLNSVCGCPQGFVRKNNICLSSYEKDAKRIYLNYTLRGENSSLDFVVYGGFADYISKVPRSIYYLSADNSSRADFILKAINEEEQRKFLMPLVIKIQNITNNKEDQARIAISIVQNIPFGFSNKTSTFGSNKINYSTYPYEVLYDMKGICGERTDLLAFLLREIGYGTVSFYYPSYNHEALGIKCPMKESLMESGYCFVETTGPSIITDNEISYVGIGKLYDPPEVYSISNGTALGEGIYEYSDASKLIRIRDFIEKNGWLGPLREITFKKLKEKYGLVNEYNSG